MARYKRISRSQDLTDPAQLAILARQSGLNKVADEIEQPKLSFLQRVGRGLNAFEIGNALYESKYEDASFLKTYGEDIKLGISGGITGRDTRRGDVKKTFKDILMQEGMKDRIGKLDAVDVLGLAGDILFDPMTWLGGYAGKAAKKGAGIGTKFAKKLPIIGKRIAKAEDVVSGLFKPFSKQLKLGDITVPGKIKSKVVKDAGEQYVRGFTKFVKGTRAQSDDFVNMMAKSAKQSKKLFGKDSGKIISGTIETGAAKKSGIRTGHKLLDDTIDRLLDTQASLTKQELDRGILRKQLDNYVHHMLTPQASSWMESGGNVGGFVSKFKKTLGATKHRGIEGTIDAINIPFKKQYGFNLFEPDAFKAFTKRGLDSIKRINSYDFAQRVGKQFGQKAKEDFIDEAGVKWVSSTWKDIPVGTKLPAPIVEHLDEYSKLMTGDKSTGEFLKMFDSLQNFWKKTVTGYFPAFHTRNAIGGTFNNWIAGLKDPKMYIASRKVLSGADGILKTSAGDIPYSQVLKMMKENGVIGQTGFLDVVKKLGEEVSPTVGTKIANAPQKIMGVFEDNLRAPLFTDGLKKYYTKELVAKFSKEFTPEIAKRKALEAASERAAKRVIKYHFDYMPEGFTKFERDIMKRVIPFYTWTRHNVPLQLEQMIMQPGKYAGVMKLQRAFGLKPSSEEESILPAWLKDRFTIKAEGGYWSGLGLPLEEATEKISDPLRGLGLSLSPFIKTPFELLTGHNIFKNKKISEDTYGKAYRNAPAPIKKFLQLKETKNKNGTIFYTVNPERRYWLELFGARGLSTFTKAMNNVEKDAASTARGLLTTINKYEYSMEDMRSWSDREAREKLEKELVKAGTIGQGSYNFIIKNK